MQKKVVINDNGHLATVLRIRVDSIQPFETNIFIKSASGVKKMSLKFLLHMNPKYDFLKEKIDDCDVATESEDFEKKKVSAFKLKGAEKLDALIAKIDKKDPPIPPKPYNKMFKIRSKSEEYLNKLYQENSFFPDFSVDISPKIQNQAVYNSNNIRKVTYLCDSPKKAKLKKEPSNKTPELTNQGTSLPDLLETSDFDNKSTKTSPKMVSMGIGLSFAKAEKPKKWKNFGKLSFKSNKVQHSNSTGSDKRPKKYRKKVRKQWSAPAGTKPQKYNK